jgi:SAM-dependent methyltransferase
LEHKYYYREHIAGYRKMVDEGKKSWDELHGNSDGFENFSSRPFLDEALPRLRFAESQPAVLEYGTGTGPVACYLAKRGFRVDAGDLIPKAIEIAKGLAEEQELDIHYEVLDICNLPHEGTKYDMIVDSFCLQGIVMNEDRERVFSAVKARLKQGGYYLISTAMYTDTRDFPDERIIDPDTGKVYTRYGPEGIFDREAEIFYEPFFGDTERKDNPEDYDNTIKVAGNWYIPTRRYRNPQSLKAELEAHGFRVLLQSGDLGGHVVCCTD